MTEFEKLVSNMRKAQKEYFSGVKKLGRSDPSVQQTLTTSKSLEKEVDSYLANKADQQVKLF